MSTHAAGTPTDVVAPAFERPGFTPAKTGAAVAHSLFGARRSEGLAAAKPARIPATPDVRSAANDPPDSVPTLMESPFRETAGGEDRALDGSRPPLLTLPGCPSARAEAPLDPRKTRPRGERDRTPEGTLRAAPGFPPRLFSRLSEPVLPPAPLDEGAHLRAHPHLVGPGAREPLRRPLPRGVDPDLRAEVREARGVVEGLDRAEDELEVALRVDVVERLPGDLARVLDVRVGVEDDDDLREHRLPEPPDPVHHLAGVAGEALLDRDEHQVVEDPLPRHVDVDDLGELLLQE